MSLSTEIDYQFYEQRVATLEGELYSAEARLEKAQAELEELRGRYTLAVENLDMYRQMYSDACLRNRGVPK